MTFQEQEGQTRNVYEALLPEAGATTSQVGMVWKVPLPNTRIVAR